MQAYFLSGVASKYGLKIEDIDGLKKVFYEIYLEKAANPTESIGLPGLVSPACCLSWVMCIIPSGAWVAASLEGF